MGKVKVGTCGFQKARRRHYEALDAVEVQQTFYDPPSPGTLEGWRREAPGGFEFTVKAWMLVTHEYNRRLWARLRRRVEGDPSRFGGFKLTREVLWAWEVTLESARALGARVVVVQTPAGFRANEENAGRVVRFFREAPRDSFTIAWEPRGDWWERRDLLYQTASKADLIVAGDVLRGRLPPEGQEVLYARLHGLGGREVNYRYKYTEEDLERLKGLVAGWREAYVMFNNVYAFEDAVRFKEVLGRG